MTSHSCRTRYAVARASKHSQSEPRPSEEKAVEIPPVHHYAVRPNHGQIQATAFSGATPGGLNSTLEMALSLGTICMLMEFQKKQAAKSTRSEVID